MTRTVALTILMFAAIAAPPAAATAREPMTFELASRIAVDYWQQRDVQLPCTPVEHLLTYEDVEGWGYDIQMLTDESTCTIDVTPWADAEGWAYCQAIVHEFGHLAGLEHSADPDSIMAPDPWVVPFGCSHPRVFAYRHGDGCARPAWVRGARARRLWLAGRAEWRVRAAAAKWRRDHPRRALIARAAICPIDT